MNVARCVSSMATSSRQTRASAPRATTMSLRATWRTLVDSARPSRRIRPSRAIRSSIVVLAGCDPGQDRLELARLGLREEADLAEVDAEDRDVDLGDGADRAQERAVAAEDDEGVGRRQLAQQGVEVARRGLPLVDARASGTSRRRGRSVRRRPRSSGCRRTRCARRSWRRSTVGDPVARSRRSQGRARGGRGTRGCPPVRGSARR